MRKSKILCEVYIAMICMKNVTCKATVTEKTVMPKWYNGFLYRIRKNGKNRIIH